MQEWGGDAAFERLNLDGLLALWHPPVLSVTLVQASGDMIKSELVQRIAAQNPHLYQRDVENIVNAILGEITAAMARGDRVELRGFGAFSVKHRPARTGRNPRTGAHVSVDQKSVPFFKTGKEMRERLNNRAGAPRRILPLRRREASRERAMFRKIVTAIIVVPLAIVIIAFAVANRQVVTVSFDPFSSTSPAYAASLPLFVLIFVLVILGVIIGGVAAWLRQAAWRRTARRLDADVRTLRQELEAMRAACRRGRRAP